MINSSVNDIHISRLSSGISIESKITDKMTFTKIGITGSYETDRQQNEHPPLLRAEK